MRLIDADVFAHNVVKYSHQSTKTIGQALADTPTVDAIPKSVIEDIKAEIQEHTQRYTLARESGGMGQVDWSDYLIKVDMVLEIIDKYIGDEDE